MLLLWYGKRREFFPKYLKGFSLVSKFLQKGGENNGREEKRRDSFSRCKS